MIDQFHIFQEKIFVIYMIDILQLISIINVNNTIRMVFGTLRIHRYGSLVFSPSSAAPTALSLSLVVLPTGF